MGHAIDDADATSAALERVVAEVQRTRAQIARLQAAEARLLTDAADVVLAREQQRQAAGRRAAHDLPLREVTSELGAAMRLSDRTVQARMSAASTLVERFPKTLRALRKGRVDFAHASAIADCGAAIGDELMRAEYERILLEAAKYETPSRLRAIARVVAARIDPEMAAQLQRQAIGQRRVRVIDLDDGMARLLADLPAVLAHAIFDRLTQMAEEERRTEVAACVTAADVTAADVTAADVVDPEGGGTAAANEVGGEASGVPGAFEPAESPCGAICTAPDGDVRTLDEMRADIFADLVLTGGPTAHGEGDALASIRAKGGETAEGNLANFCRRHHTVKHATAWRVQQLGQGVLKWTSLTGRRYLDRPPPVVRFVPSREWATVLASGSGRDAPF